MRKAVHDNIRTGMTLYRACHCLEEHFEDILEMVTRLLMTTATHRTLGTEDITALVAEIPVGHQHLRTTLTLADGSALTLQEATVAAIVRAYIAIKTDPARTRVIMKGRALQERKPGYAAWQLLEE